jgi:sugar (pentulose or hexulose) kinase
MHVHVFVLSLTSLSSRTPSGRGFTASHTRADPIRAVIEGVYYSQRDCLDIIEAMGVVAPGAPSGGSCWPAS